MIFFSDWAMVGGKTGAPPPDSAVEEPTLKKKEARKKPKKKWPKFSIGLKSSAKGKKKKP